MFKIILFSIMGLLSLEFTPSQSLFNKEWKTKTPLVIDGVKMQGFLLLLNEEYNNEWNSEGVMFESITRGTRNFSSSFDYKITPDTLKLKITFSTAGLDSGNVYSIPYTLNEKQLTLNYYGKESIYK
jgi:hypothetical protein